MHTVVAGDDEVGLHITETLMNKHPVVLIAPEAWRAPRLDKLDAEVVRGRPTSPEVLESADIRHCDLFIACTSSDEMNIVACLAARRLGAARTTCMLSRPGFFDARDSDEELAQSLGVDVVVRPWERLAREILRIATVPGALDVRSLIGGRISLLRIAVEKGAPIVGTPLKNVTMPGEVLLAMVVRGERVFLPDGNTVIAPGDKVTAIGRPRSVRKLRSNFLQAPHHAQEARRAAIVGGGVVGFLVAIGLEENGWEVVVIEQNRRRCEEIAPLLPRSIVLNGDGSDIDLLEEERIPQCSVLVAVTNNDEKNLLVSLIARHLGVDRVITRAERLSNEKLFERVGVDVVRSAHGAAARSVVRHVVDPRSEIRAELEHGDVHVIEVELQAQFQPTALMDLQTNLFSMIAVVVRGSRVIVARGDTVLQPSDHLFIVCSQEDEVRAREYYVSATGVIKDAATA